MIIKLHRKAQNNLRMGDRVRIVFINNRGGVDWYYYIKEDLEETQIKRD